MKEIQLSINGERLFERMKTESGKVAQIKESAGQSEKLSTHTIITNDEKEFVEDYISTAINECVTIISHYLGACRPCENSTPNNINLCIAIPENWAEDATESLKDIITNIIYNRSLQQWYMLVRADDTNLCASKIQLYMKQLQEVLSIRKRPQ
jgi:hypothetical protein